MTFGFRSEVGYDAVKDLAFFRTETPDFTEQLTLPLTRGSAEDLSVRGLLEDQGIVDFAALNAAVHLPTTTYEMAFGLVGGEEDENLIPENYPHLVLFGKEGSGAVNLIRFWLLWASQTGKRIVTVGTPDDLYGSAKYMMRSKINALDPKQPLREQFEALGSVEFYNGAEMTLFLVGADYQTETLEDRLFLKEMQNGAYYQEKNLLDHHRVLSLIHRAHEIYMNDMPFTGSDGDAENVTLAVIGDVGEVAARKVGKDVPNRNARGIAWFSRGGEEAKRIKTYVVSRELVEAGPSWLHPDWSVNYSE